MAIQLGSLFKANQGSLQALSMGNQNFGNAQSAGLSLVKQSSANEMNAQNSSLKAFLNQQSFEESQFRDRRDHEYDVFKDALAFKEKQRQFGTVSANAQLQSDTNRFTNAANNANSLERAGIQRDTTVSQNALNRADIKAKQISNENSEREYLNTIASQYGAEPSPSGNESAGMDSGLLPPKEQEGVFQQVANDAVASQGSVFDRAQSNQGEASQTSQENQLPNDQPAIDGYGSMSAIDLQSTYESMQSLKQTALSDLKSIQGTPKTPERARAEKAILNQVQIYDSQTHNITAALDAKGYDNKDSSFKARKSDDPVSKSEDFLKIAGKMNDVGVDKSRKEIYSAVRAAKSGVEFADAMGINKTIDPTGYKKAISVYREINSMENNSQIPLSAADALNGQ